MSFETIRYEKKDGAVWITFNRPKLMNALDVHAASELRRALADLRHDAEARVLVITGSGRGFCAGGDVASFHANLDEAPRLLREIIFNLHASINYLLDLPIPVVVGINGVTAGAGLGVCMAGDLAIAAASAKFTMAYTAIGATPDGASTVFLPRLVGTRRAMELALTNRTLTADEALDWGLVNRVVPDEQFAGELETWVTRIANGPTRAFARTRRLINESLHTPAQVQLENEGNSIIAMGATDDFREGVTAFVEKRRARFKGS